MAKWTATVIARNEQDTIEECLRCIRNEAPPEQLKIHVMVNGSTDATYSRAISSPCATSIYRDIVPGKARAWNAAVHYLLADADVHFFVDAYALVRPGSFQAMADQLAATRANACAAIPRSGRSQAMLAHAARIGKIHGSLHALSGDFVARIKHRRIRLPEGLYRVDGLVGSMALHDLDHTKGWNYAHVACAEEAGWVFQSLSPFSLADWRRWWTRRRNQRLGAEQIARLKPTIYSQGFEHLPEKV